MSEEVILQFMAQDDISPVIQTLQTNVITAMEGIQQAVSTMSSGFDNSTVSVNSFGSAQQVIIGSGKDATNVINENTKSVKENSGGLKENNNTKQTFTKETDTATNSVNTSASALDNHTNIANMSAGSLMYLAGQMSTMGTQAEQSAKALNDTLISLGQVAKMSGTTEGEMRDMITTMSNETFSNDEAIMYVKNLTQMGVASENFVEQATNIDRINDAFGLGAETTNSLVTELSVLGVDMNDVSSSFNALAYANENTKGGMENFYAFLRKYDAELNQLGYDTDQAAIIISAATQKYGGGRAALTGLSEALKEAGSDTNALEQALDLKSGALSHASQETASYEGQLQNLADEEMEHKTVLERMGAWIDDLKIKYSGAFQVVNDGKAVFGEVGGFALHLNALREMTYAFASLGASSGPIANTINRLKMFRTAGQEASAVTSAITPAQASMMAGGTMPVNIPKGGEGASKGAKGIGGLGKNTGKITKETTTVVKDASAIGALAPEAEAGAAGMTATSGAMAGISSAFTTMIVPLLAIAAVIAVMIPIAAALAAEALLFIKGIQVLIKALGFDKIDLSKSIEGIKQIGQALFELGLALGALTFAALMTALSNVVIMVSQIINPIKVAGNALLQAANELKVFNSVNIGKDTPEKIKSITEGIKLVAEAMGSLTDLSFSMAIGNLIGRLIGSVTDAIKTARKEIVEAAKEIDKIKDVPDLDKGAIDKLEKIGKSLDSVGKAMEGLRKIRDSQNFDVSGWLGNLFGGVDIRAAIEGAKEDIISASSALKSFNNVDTVPENVTKSLESVGNALKSVGESITALRKIRDDYNWDEGIGSWFADSSVTKSFDALKTDLVSVGASLKSLDASVEEGGINNISEELPEKIGNFTKALDSVLSAVESMEKFKGKGEGENSDDFTGIEKTITNAKDSLVKVSEALKSLSGNEKGEGGLQSVGEEVAGKIDAINKTLGQISSSITTIKGLPEIDAQATSSSIGEIVKAIGNTVDEINKLDGHERIHAGIWTTVVQTGTGARNLGQTARVLNGLPSVNSANIKSRASESAKAVGYAIDEINTLNGHQRIQPGIWTTIAQTGTSAKNLGKTARTLNGLPNVNSNSIKTKTKNAVGAVKKVSAEIKKLKSSDKVGNVSSILNSINKAVASLKKTLSASAGSFKTAGVEIAEGLKNGINQGLGNLKDVVISQVASNMEQAKPTAFTYGKGIGGRAVSGFQESFKLSEIISNELSASATAIANGTPQLTSAMGQLADQMVSEFKAHADIASPGAIAKSIRDEMGYTRGFIETRGKYVIESVGNLARGMVSTFNPNLQASLDDFTGRLGTGRINALRNLNTSALRTDEGSRPVNIVINEGAVQLDARNLTTKESRQVMINAIEGLDVIDGINVKGV